MDQIIQTTIRRRPTDVLCGIEYQLTRIAELLEAINTATNPLNVYDTLDDGSVIRTFYTNETEDIIREKLAAMGKEYKPRK